MRRIPRTESQIARVEVYAKEQGSSRETCLGALVLRSDFVSSDFGDLMLNFEHTGKTVEPTRLEQLEQLPSELVLARANGGATGAPKA